MRHLTQGLPLASFGRAALLPNWHGARGISPSREAAGWTTRRVVSGERDDSGQRRPVHLFPWPSRPLRYWERENALLSRQGRLFHSTPVPCGEIGRLQCRVRRSRTVSSCYRRRPALPSRRCAQNASPSCLGSGNSGSARSGPGTRPPADPIVGRVMPSATGHAARFVLAAGDAHLPEPWRPGARHPFAAVFHIPTTSGFGPVHSEQSESGQRARRAIPIAPRRSTRFRAARHGDGAGVPPRMRAILGFRGKVGRREEMRRSPDWAS